MLTACLLRFLLPESVELVLDRRYCLQPSKLLVLFQSSRSSQALFAITLGALPLGRRLGKRRARHLVALQFFLM